MAQIGDPDAAEKSKDDGTFVLDGVPDGEAVVSVTAKDHASREIAVIVNEDTPPLEIGLVTGGKIAGMVVAPDGTPAQGHAHAGRPGITPRHAARTRPAPSPSRTLQPGATG